MTQKLFNKRVELVREKTIEGIMAGKFSSTTQALLIGLCAMDDEKEYKMSVEAKRLKISVAEYFRGLWWVKFSGAFDIDLEKGKKAAFAKDTFKFRISS